MSLGKNNSLLPNMNSFKLDDYQMFWNKCFYFISNTFSHVTVGAGSPNISSCTYAFSSFKYAFMINMLIARLFSSSVNTNS